MMKEIGALTIFSIGILTEEYVACIMSLLTLLILIKNPKIQFFKQLEGGKKK